MKRTIPLLITALVGLLMVAAAFIPPFASLAGLATEFFSVIAAIAFILGAGNFMRVHWDKIARQQTGWGYSGVAMASFLAMLLSGLFKINVEPAPGFYSLMRPGPEVVALAEVKVAGSSRELNLTVRGAAPETKYPVSVDGVPLGEMTTDKGGQGKLSLKAAAPPADSKAEQSPAQGALIKLKADSPIAIGSLATGTFEGFGWYTGEVDSPTSVFGWIYDNAFVPLQQTTFALLAFYVASAAFRAFRARNVESVLLLGTAFIILLGRTAAGTFLTQWLPQEGALSFFTIPNLTNWLMSFPVTAGQRAILIGIALGVASTSLKVLLGIDRSYLGSDREQ